MLVLTITIFLLLAGDASWQIPSARLADGEGALSHFYFQGKAPISNAEGWKLPIPPQDEYIGMVPSAAFGWNSYGTLFYQRQSLTSNAKGWKSQYSSSRYIHWHGSHW